MVDWSANSRPKRGRDSIWQRGLPNNQGGAVIAINSQMTYGVDYIAALSSVDSLSSPVFGPTPGPVAVTVTVRFPLFTAWVLNCVEFSA